MGVGQQLGLRPLPLPIILPSPSLIPGPDGHLAPQSRAPASPVDTHIIKVRGSENHFSLCIPACLCSVSYLAYSPHCMSQTPNSCLGIKEISLITWALSEGDISSPTGKVKAEAEGEDSLPPSTGLNEAPISPLYYCILTETPQTWTPGSFPGKTYSSSILSFLILKGMLPSFVFWLESFSGCFTYPGYAFRFWAVFGQ